MAASLRFAAALLAAFTADAAAQPAPGSPHSAGFTPFRARAFAGSSIDVAALEQNDSPVRIIVGSAARDERGLTVSLQLENLTIGPSTRQVLGAWVFTPDGTVRGYQRFESRRAIAAGEIRPVEFTIRQSTTNIVQGDLTVIAVQESAGTPPWRQDQAALQKAARDAVLR